MDPYRIDPTPSPVTPTGVKGLDHVLGGGLPTNRVFLIEGMPGTGKTTLALEFLREGVRLGETALYVALAETRQEAAAFETRTARLDGSASLSAAR